MLKISWVMSGVTSNWIRPSGKILLGEFSPRRTFSNDEHFLKFCYVVRYPVLTPGKSNSVAAYTISQNDLVEYLPVARKASYGWHDSKRIMQCRHNHE